MGNEFMAIVIIQLIIFIYSIIISLVHIIFVKGEIGKVYRYHAYVITFISVLLIIISGIGFLPFLILNIPIYVFTQFVLLPPKFT